MDKKYNGFNNGRDKSDGVGGREVNHGTQQTMTKEQILEKHSTKLTDGTCICSKTSRLRAMQEYAKQEVAKEREKAKKLVESAKNVLLCERDGQLVSGILSLHILELKQSLTEYEKL